MPKLTFGLRARLAALVLLCVAPVSVIVVQISLAQRHEATASVQREVVLLARLVARHHERVIEGASQLLTSFAHASGQVSGDKSSVCAALSRDFLDQYHRTYANIAVTDEAGNIVCDARGGGVSVNISDREYFKLALAERRFVVGEYQVGRTTGVPSVPFARPIVDANRRSTGIVLASLDLSSLGDMGIESQLPSGAVYFLIDRRGVVLVRSIDSDKWIGKSGAGHPLVRQMLAGGEGIATLPDLDGITRMYAFSPVKSESDVPFVAGVGLPQDFALAADRALARGLGWLSLATLIALAAVWIGGDVLVLKPVNGLLDATRHLAAGDLAARAPATSGVTEVRDLSRNFNDMAATLELGILDLREAEAKYRGVVEQSLVGVYIVQDGRFAYVNHAMAEMYGYTQEEMLGLASVLEIVAETDRETVAGNLAKRLDGRVKSLRYVVTGRRKDGTLTQTEAHGSRAEYRGRPAVIGIALDITDKQRLEEQFHQAQKMEAIGRLAGGVAHDFNNLLTAILGYCDLLLEQVAEEPLRAELGEIHRAAVSASALTHQLLAFSRKQVTQQRVLDLNTVIAGFEKMLRRLIGEDVRVITRLAPGLSLVKADGGQIEQVLVNLVINARDAMPNGGMLTVETAVVELDEAYADAHLSFVPGPHVMLAVSDTGTGMSAGVRSRLFEPFFTTKEAGKGTGLGLATIYGIVKQQGGNIWVYSELGRGTTFKVYWPVAGAEASEQTVAAPIGNLSGTETILVVEDNPSLRELALKILRKRGYTVLVASGGDEGILVSEQHEGAIDLLLSDVVMPGLNGRELAARLLGRRPRMRILYMSGYTDDAILHLGVLDEGIVLLEKPFTPDGLAAKVRQVLDEPA